MDGEIMPEKKSSLSKNVILGITGTVLTKAISFITVIIVGYLMTADLYGNLSVYTTIISIIGVIIGFQFSGSLQNALFKYKEKYDSYCSSVLIVSFISSIIIFIPILFLGDQIGGWLKIDSTLIYFMIPQCYGSFLIGFMTTYFLSKKEVLKNLIWSFIYALAVTCLSLLCSYLMENKVLGYVIGQCSINVIMGCLVLITFLKRSKFRINTDYIKFALKFSLPLILHMIGTIIMGQCDKLMIRYMIDEVATGEYSMIHNYAMLLNSLWGAINSVFIPYYYDDLLNGDKKVINKRCLEYYFVFGIISFVFMFMGRDIIRLIVPSEYYNGLIVFPMAVLSQFLVFIYSFSVNYEFYKQKTLWISIGTLISAGINIGLNYFLINLWGIYGAAFASSISYLCLIIFHEMIARIIVKDYPLKPYFSLIGVGVGFSLTFVCQSLNEYWYIRLIIAVLMGVALLCKLIRTKRIF